MSECALHLSSCGGAFIDYAAVLFIQVSNQPKYSRNPHGISQNCDIIGGRVCWKNEKEVEENWEEKRAVVKWGGAMFDGNWAPS